ncbi:MAG: putative bifunctional diguanylate cyclase/phosphodiesterase [Polyangiales bacterium]
MTTSVAPAPDNSLRQRVQWGLVSVLLLGAPFVFLYWWSGINTLVVAHVIASGGCLVLLLAIRRLNRPKAIGEVGIGLLFGLLIYSSSISGGFYSASFTWFLVAPVGAALVMGPWVAARWSILSVSITIAFWLDSTGGGVTSINQIPLGHRPVHALANLTLCIAAVGALVWIFVRGHANAEERAFMTQRELLEEQERLRVLASYDYLTTLPNRHSLERNLARCLKSGPLGLVYLNLDRFKDINDGFGLIFGDALLVEVAQRFSQVVYDGPAPVHASLELYDAGPMLARMASDEFVVIMPHASSDEAASMARKLVRSLDAPFEIGLQRLCITCSVGISMGPGDGADVRRLLRTADIALSMGKARGSGNVDFFRKGALESVRRRVHLESNLRDAIERHELELYYQPLFTPNETLIGAEALLRWTSPTLGRVGPEEFIAIAEHSGQMSAIGLWVLESACREACQWAPEIRVSVNVSVTQLRSGELVKNVKRVLASTGLPASRLELEITESLLADDELTRSVLSDLCTLGVSLALDDFGTGFSSLGVLRSLPVDCLKIDRSFVQSMHTSASDAALVRTIVAMGRELGLRVLAEGVEEREQLRALRELGCDEIQGFLLGRPMSAEDFLAQTREARRTTRAPARLQETRASLVPRV